MALRSRYVELANGLDNVRFKGGVGGCYPVPAYSVGARGTDFKRFEIESNKVTSGRKRATRCSIRMPILRLLSRMMILAPLRIEERVALNDENVRRASVRGGERIVRDKLAPCMSEMGVISRHRVALG